jgi:uncharacterized protein YlxP (DUF503 family)
MESSPVYIGVYLVTLELPWVHSLKEKRAAIAPVTEKLKARFPVSVARLDGLDAHTWERIGVCAISSDPVWLEGILNKAAAFIAAHGSYEVRGGVLELERWEGEPI